MRLLFMVYVSDIVAGLSLFGVKSKLFSLRYAVWLGIILNVVIGTAVSIRETQIIRLIVPTLFLELTMIEPFNNYLLHSLIQLCGLGIYTAGL